MTDRELLELAARAAGYIVDRAYENGGAHLIVQSANGSIDFWPGTGPWKSGCGKSGRGIKNLLRFLRTTENTK